MGIIIVQIVDYVIKNFNLYKSVSKFLYIIIKILLYDNLQNNQFNK